MHQQCRYRPPAAFTGTFPKRAEIDVDASRKEAALPTAESAWGKRRAVEFAPHVSDVTKEYSHEAPSKGIPEKEH